MNNVLTVIVMATSDCNMDCGYCYAKLSRRSIKSLDVSCLKNLIQNISSGFDSIEFCWHGGEPLLVGTDFYREALKFQREEMEKRKVRFRNVVQTNGFLLSGKTLDFLVENGFSIGLSVDAPQDIFRLHRGADIEPLLAVCGEIKRRNIPLQVLCVVSAANVGRGKEIFSFFQSLGVDSFGLLPLRYVSEVYPPPPTNENLFTLYKTVFDLWAWTPNNFSSIEPLNTMLRSLLGERPQYCSFAGSCLKKMIAVDQEGNVVPCVSLAGRDSFVLGNVLEQPLVEILATNRANELRNMRARCVSQRCGKCPFVASCRGGCRAEAVWATGRYDGIYPFCEARRMTFEYLQSHFLSKIPR
ncbi:MAG: radical SAM protein [Candidatus Jorgensenbacteria bacterium]